MTRLREFGGGIHGLVVVCAVGCTAAGCLSAFAPAVRVTGPHAEARADDTPADCLSCHELESAAVERLARTGGAMPDHDRAHANKAVPLVADWMVEEAPRCTDCHRLRGHPK